MFTLEALERTPYVWGIEMEAKRETLLQLMQLSIVALNAPDSRE
ncbi:hypothetical protein [Gloeobacter violaceus]|nr:hypothetical protein [Gloeobacter violaceus]